MRIVNTSVRKKDAMALVTGQPVYTDDIAPKNCLIVKVLRSPHAHAIIKEIKTSDAKNLYGVECVLTYNDVPQKRFTMAGQTYPEFSPYDRYILEDRVRFVGDAVAVVAAKDEKTAEKALKLIKVEYEVLKPVLDFRTAKDNQTIVHPEEDWKALVEVGGDRKRNLCASGVETNGDLDSIMSNCDVIVSETYHTKAVQQSMMETFRTFTYYDTYGRLNIVSSTQVPFHVRRILSNALDIPKSQIRVLKPRIGGGFGAKQTVVSEVYPAIVTMLTKKPAKIVYTREESLIASSPRHEMEVKVRIGADCSGKIKAIEINTLSNTGAFGEHGPTTVGLSGHKSIPLYTANCEAFRFSYDVVYTNHMSAGAYRGYGATQGQFALESAVNQLASRLNIDPVKIREMNMVRQGMIMPAYYNEPNNSCTLDKCLETAKKNIGWDEKYPCRDMGNGKVRSVGIAMSMQGSGISNVDKGSVTIKLNDDGFYSMNIGATDMGTGCDTVLAQMVAETMECDLDNVVVYGVDTDTSPYDTGSYASSTTYITGTAAVHASNELKQRILDVASTKLNVPESDLVFDGKVIRSIDNKKEITLKDIANEDMCGNNAVLEVTSSNFSPVSPPPFMVGAVEIEVDKETGHVEVINYEAVVDCGTTINPNLARVQTEGGIVQGIGMALFEDIIYDNKGNLFGTSFMQYKIPSRLDMGKVNVSFESSYEPTGPFGAKSIGEVVINTPAPAIAHAVYNATGVWHRELPITPEKVIRGMIDLEN
ncbi:xanthine dehydrogenase family protein molybdopterin-binding subunit [Anaerotignum sp. MB30-C6]|uniref:xanthine dehydrogenase family protein molybdopterin-binding subunit n=1 Tax=Anaerotignum sp. MB30-C6 TaxID=3070814 RepID=UPI0027DDB788|nr:molybdopterin cofactor-binding domain-containing protein [Anaerotignum sp. MB30-C6]WMI79961.1 molybdopterin-dependent oxidoreductase [Anaerotignum sp. MB30-C6]